MSVLAVRWISIRDAKRFVAAEHRHHRPDKGGIVALGCFAGRELVGVAVIGRPKARMLDDGSTAEVTRVAVARRREEDGIERGTPDACSMLYGRARNDEHPTQTKIRWEAP